MPSYRYQGTPQTPPALTIATTSGTTTSAKAGTYYFWLQYRNIAGYSLFSTPISAAIAAGGGLNITIPTAALPSPSGVDIKEYIVLAASTLDPVVACVVAKKPGYAVDGVTANTPPFTIALTADEHLELSKHVANNAALPTGGNRVVGMRRYLDDTSKIKEWDGTVWVDCNPQLFNTFVGNDRTTGGQAIELSDLLDTTIVLTPTYNTDSGSASNPVGYWIVNNSSTDPILKGTRVGLTVKIGDLDVSGVTGIVGGLLITFQGYVSVVTGVLDTTGEGGSGTMSGVGVQVPYQGPSTVLSLPKDLPAGSAYWLQVQLNATTAQLNNRCTDGTQLQFFPYFYTDYATYEPSGDLLGSFIKSSSKRRRVVPKRGLGAIALDGSGQIVSPVGGAFTFPVRSSQPIVGVAQNTSAQKVAITVNGTCFATTGTLTSDVALRALIGTINGVGKPSPWDGSVTLGPSTRLTVTVTYPTAIRADYPDVIAGSADGEFNATYIRIYVRPVGGGTVTQFEQLITPSTASETFALGITVGTDIGSGSLPTRSDSTFGLYEPTTGNFTVGTQAGASSFSAGTYEVAIGFRYVDTVTTVTHSSDSGCIYEASGTLADVFQSSSFWGAGVTNFAALATLPANVLRNRQTRIAIDTGDAYTYDAGSETWLSSASPTVVADPAALRAISAPIREGRRFFVKSLMRYTRYDVSQTGPENGSGVFKPNNLGSTDPGRHIIELN